MDWVLGLVDGVEEVEFLLVALFGEALFVTLAKAVDGGLIDFEVEAVGRGHGDEFGDGAVGVAVEEKVEDVLLLVGGEFVEAVAFFEE